MKRISTLTGILIIFAALIVLIGGVLGWIYFANQRLNIVNPSQIQNENTQTTKTLSEKSVINAIENLWKIHLSIYNEKYATAAEGGSAEQWTGINAIIYGDLNNDGLQDAFIWGTACGASCGSFFMVTINEPVAPTTAFLVTPERFVESGAAQYRIDRIAINEGIISVHVSIPQFNGQSTNHNLGYKLVGKTLEFKCLEASEDLGCIPTE